MLYFLDTDCTDLLPLIRLIRHGVIPLIQIGIPIILIVLGMLDLGKAVMASKEDEIKNAQKLLIKRAMYAVAVFLVVVIVNIVMGIVATTESDDVTGDTSWNDCWKQAAE